MGLLGWNEWLLLALFVGGVVLWVAALGDCTRRQFADPNLKLIWVFAIALVGVPAALIYWFVGRPKGTLA